MYTQQIGRKFLTLYNQKTGQNLTVFEFFEKEFFPILFDSEDHLQLMQVTNSSFFQKISKQDQKKDVRNSILKKERFLNDVKEVSIGKKTISGAVAVGFMAGDIDKGTSGQISSIKFDLSEDNILYSWFGGALGVGFGGGYDFLFENEELLWFIYRGWQYYRKFLDENPKAKGRQIETWNGLWVCYGLKNKNNLDQAFRDTLDQISNNSGEQGGYIKLNRPEWPEQVFTLARYLGDDQIRELMYGYSYGQMNKTLGFLHLNLHRVKYMPEIFEQLVQSDPELRRSQTKKLEEVYRAQFPIERAATLGGIGVRSLKPKDMYKYTAGDIRQQAASIPKLDKEEKRLTFITYLTWIQAMLNNEETLKLSEEVAEVLIKYVQDEKRLTARKNEIQNLWDSRNRQQLIDHFSIIISEDEKTTEVLNKAVEQLMTTIPQDMFKLFLTLVKFKYHYYQSN